MVIECGSIYVNFFHNTCFIFLLLSSLRFCSTCHFFFLSWNKTEQNTIKEKCVICVWKKWWYLYACVCVFVLVFVIKICVCVNLKGFIAINLKFQNVYQNISLIWIKNRRLTKLTEEQMEPTSSNRWHLWRKNTQIYICSASKYVEIQ